MHNPEYLYNYVIHDKNSIHRPKEELDAWRVKVITAALQRRGITANPKVSHQTEDRYNYVAW